MRHLCTAAALLAAFMLATPAIAGSISLSLTVAGNTRTLSWSIPDADVLRIIEANRASPMPTGALDADGNPITRPRTNAEIISDLGRGFVERLKADVAAYEARKAAEAVAPPVAATQQ